MKSTKKLVFLTIIISLLCSPVLSFIIPNISNSRHFSNVDGKETIAHQGLEPYASDVDNNDKIDTAEVAADWLWDQWNLHHFNDSDDNINLGQNGVAGIGDFYIELFKKTNDQTYLEYASSIGEWLIETHDNLNYPTGKWPNLVPGLSGSENFQANFTGWEEGAAGIGAFFQKLYVNNNSENFKNQALFVHQYLRDNIEEQTTSGNGYAWLERDDNTVITDYEINPSSAMSTIGNLETGTDLSYLNDYNSSSFVILSENNKTQVEYYLQMGSIIPYLDLEDEDLIELFFNNIDFSMHLNSNTTVSVLNISLYNSYNESYEKIFSGSLDTIEQFITHEINENFSHYIGAGNLFTVLVNSNSSSPHTVEINSLNITIDYNNKYNSTAYSSGAAGIGKYYIEMNNHYENSTFLDRATGAGYFLLENMIEIDSKSAWLEKGKYYNSMGKGAGGIADFLLDIYEHDNENEPLYLSGAKKAADWIISNNASSETAFFANVLAVPEENQTIEDESLTGGFSNMAGIGSMLLKLADVSGENIYLNNASFIANWLITGFYVITSQSYGYDRYYKWNEFKFGSTDISYGTGTAGNVLFLDELFIELNSDEYAEHISGGLEWIKREINTNIDQWNSQDLYGRMDGLAGVASILLELELNRPVISASNTPAQLEYNEDLRVSFTVNPIYSTIDHCQILYKIGNDSVPISGWLSGSDTMDQNGNIFSYSFSSFNPNHDTNISYHVVAVDNNSTFSYDDNEVAGYTLLVVDTIAPTTTIIPKWSENGLAPNQKGEVEIRVAMEPPQGSPFDGLVIDSPDLGFTDVFYEDDFTNQTTYYSLSYEINIGPDVNYGEEYTVTFYTYDEKSNEYITSETIVIQDIIDPYCDVANDFDLVDITSWTVQFTPVAVEAKVYDDESGIDSEEGVYIMYTTDKGTTWQTVYLEETTSNKYEGEIPGQIFIGEVYFILGAKDKSGNEVLFDKFGGEHEDIEDVSLDLMWSYSVNINIWIVTLVAGIIAGIVIVGYLIYSRKGGYLEKMRRKSKYTATGLAIKERLTNFYYKLYDGVNSLGEKIAKGAKSGSQKVGIWVEDHFGERFKSTMRSIGRVLWAFPLGIAHGISNFFQAIGAALVKSKGWQVILFLVFGLAMLLTTVVQFVMEGGYPLRAVFFANLGFAMVIIGITTFLIRSIYRLAYK